MVFGILGRVGGIASCLTNDSVVLSPGSLNVEADNVARGKVFYAQPNSANAGEDMTKEKPQDGGGGGGIWGLKRGRPSHRYQFRT